MNTYAPAWADCRKRFKPSPERLDGDFPLKVSFFRRFENHNFQYFLGRFSSLSPRHAEPFSATTLNTPIFPRSS
ncbi:hypothetical protein [Hydrogenimonas urashimensis]|uniref:hypothetical protein n=1 Tax=Hydrogenimonas urashimensis TaxID=2740515 RepID=UPI0019154E08|nr:hypothetical protein [Hydrogenimonas urashimensis]